MSITTEHENWAHQALNPRDPRLPVEMMRIRASATGNASGGFNTQNFVVRTRRPSSQVYALASVEAEDNALQDFNLLVQPANFSLGGVLSDRTWSMTTLNAVGGRRSLQASELVMRNVMLGTPSGAAVALISCIAANDDGITTFVNVSIFRFLPTVWQAGGPVFPQGIF